MIGFYRKKLGLEYAHAGIYAPVSDNQKYVVHVQAQGGSFRSVMGQSEVKCEELEKVIGEYDKVFFIRECENSMAQADILRKLEACLFEKAIQYTYNSCFGSCQTFCSRILGSTLFEELNPEAFLTSASGVKEFAYSELSH